MVCLCVPAANALARLCSGPPRGLSALCVPVSCQGHSKLGSPCSLASLVYTDFSAHSSQNQHPRENGASHQKDPRLQLVKESLPEDALLKSLYHQLRLTLYNLLKSVVIFILNKLLTNTASVRKRGSLQPLEVLGLQKQTAVKCAHKKRN